MVDAIEEGKLKSIYLKGEDMITSDSNANLVGDALSKLDFFVVQDIVMSETARFADVILPASPSLEREGTFTNTERRIQRLYQALEPLGESRPDWRIIRDLANELGANWKYDHPSEIMAEAASLAPLFAGVTYERLEGYKTLQWPVAKDGSDQPLLFTKKFPPPDGKARLFPLKWQEPGEQTSDQFDLHLNNGRLLEHFEQGSMTYRSDGIKEITPNSFLEVSPELAAERGLESGRWVHLGSANGKIKVQVLVTDRVQGKQMYMPMNTIEEPVNRLTSSNTDVVTHTPAFKETAVNLTLLPDLGHNPLPRRNFRWVIPPRRTALKLKENGSAETTTSPAPATTISWCKSKLRSKLDQTE